MLYYDREREFQRIQEGAINTVAGLQSFGSYVWNNPGEALSRAGSGALNYLDKLTSDPETAGKLLGQAVTAWATGGATAAGKKLAQETLGALWDLGKNLRRVPDGGYAKPRVVGTPKVVAPKEIVAQDGTRISGHTKHGLDRAIGDGAKRAGVKPSAILDALKNPKKITSGIDKLGRPFKIFEGLNARIIVNPDTGRIVSMNPLSGGGVR